MAATFTRRGTTDNKTVSMTTGNLPNRKQKSSDHTKTRMAKHIKASIKPQLEPPKSNLIFTSSHDFTKGRTGFQEKNMSFFRWSTSDIARHSIKSPHELTRHSKYIKSKLNGRSQPQRTATTNFSVNLVDLYTTISSAGLCRGYSGHERLGDQRHSKGRNTGCKPETELPCLDHDRFMQRVKNRKTHTFKWSGRVVRTLVALLGRMRRLSMGKTQQSTYSEFLNILSGTTTGAAQEEQGKESQSLVFDKSWFLRSRAWWKMPLWAQSVMRLPSEERTTDEVHHLKKLLNNMRSFRENLTEDMRTQLCHVVGYTRCEQGRVVLRQGHIGLDFYFIFSGSVIVQSECHDEKTGEVETLVENVLRAGEMFGELALLGDGRRTASVICNETTELCQVDKATFMSLCSSMFEDQLQLKITSARRFDIFQTWDSEDLRQICFMSQALDVPHSRIIEKNWATSKFVYFVMSGRASMIKEFDAPDVPKMAGQNGVRQPVWSTKVKGKRSVKQFARVGMLEAGECSDLSVLATIPQREVAEITLVSEGACLFRVAVRTFQKLSSGAHTEEYLRTYSYRRFPTDDELRAHYLADRNWRNFKKNMVASHCLEKTRNLIASRPTSFVGSVGRASRHGLNNFPMIDQNWRTIEAVSAANKSWTAEAVSAANKF